jgi:hypothetical protein
MLMDVLMARIGVGTATLTLKLKTDTFPRASTIDGILTLEGGTVEQPIARLIVKLMEYRQAGKSSHWVQLNQSEVVEDISIAPQEMQKYTFQLPVPASTRLTTNAAFLNNTTRVVAEADILWAVNPRTQVDVHITPEPEILILDSAMRRLGFTSPIQAFETPLSVFLFSFPEDAFNGTVQKTYSAPSSLQEQITHATLQLHIEQGWVQGRLLLNRREIHLTDYWKAMTGGDKEEFPIEVSCERLRNKEGLATAVTIVREILDRTLILPDNEKNWLLRASHNPDTGADSLLRPAASDSASPVGELLIPSSPDHQLEEG